MSLELLVGDKPPLTVGALQRLDLRMRPLVYSQVTRSQKPLATVGLVTHIRPLVSMRISVLRQQTRHTKLTLASVYLTHILPPRLGPPFLRLLSLIHNRVPMWRQIIGEPYSGLYYILHRRLAELSNELLPLIIRHLVVLAALAVLAVLAALVFAVV